MFNGHRNLDGNSDINLHGDNLERVIAFKYLGSTLAENGELDAKMTHRMDKTGRGNRGFCVIEEYKLEGQWESVQNDCKTSNMMYAAETWAVNKSQYIAEMRVLRWISGVTKLDRIRN